MSEFHVTFNARWVKKMYGRAATGRRHGSSIMLIVGPPSGKKEYFTKSASAKNIFHVI